MLDRRASTQAYANASGSGGIGRGTAGGRADAGDRREAFLGEQAPEIARELLVGRTVAAVVHVVLKVLTELARRGVAVGRVDLERLHHDRLELLRDVRIQPARRLD